MAVFLDEFTGNRYEFGPEWLDGTKKTVADRIRPLLNRDIKHAADNVARFWSDEYYRLIFPCASDMNSKINIFSNKRICFRKKSL